MNYNNVFIILFFVGILYDFFINHFLEFIDWSFRKKHGLEIPIQYAEHFNKEKLKEICAYENAKYFFWIPKNIVTFLLSIGLVVSGYYVKIFDFSWTLTENVYLTILLFVFFMELPGNIVMIPFSLYKEFKIEKKFGFSNMTLKMYFMDALKETIVSLVIMIPILLAVVAFIGHFEKLWWLYFGIFYLVLALGLSYVYPVWIAPLFNKFAPLEEGELKTKIETLFNKTGFTASGIFIMDASKRSKHSNAYFTGLGKNKRIVLFDTLVNQLTVDEVIAVLAHELGHCKHHHIIKKMIGTIPLIFIGLFIISILIKNDSLYSGFGFDLEKGFVALKFVGIYLVSLSFGGFGSLVSLVSNALSRHDEFQADRYSKQMVGSEISLINALIKLNKENLSELVPPKVYSLFNYSHPPLWERAKALQK